jgi:hypothetical protein
MKRANTKMAMNRQLSDSGCPDANGSCVVEQHDPERTMLSTDEMLDVLLAFVAANSDKYAWLVRCLVLLNKDSSTKTIEYMKRPHLDDDTGRGWCAMARACEWCGGAFGEENVCTADLCDLTSGESTCGFHFCNPCLEKNILKMERSDLSQPPRQVGPSRFDQRIFDRRLGLPGTADLHRRINHTFFVTFLLSEPGARPAITQRVRAHDMRAFIESFQPYLDAHDARMREREEEFSDDSSDDDFSEVVLM